jgi:hypothetical protein
MFLKILFYFLAIWWVLLALKPLFRISPPPPPKPAVRKRPKEDEGEYVDYEEVE